MMETTKVERRRWYDRGEPEPENEPAITQRDLSILLDLYDNRFMSTRQLQTLYGARVFRRLHRLFTYGYIDRPRAQRIWRMREGGGSNPGIYAIANRGARTLAAFGVIEADRRDFSERNRELAEFSLRIPHELAVSDVRVAFRRACALRGDVRLGHAEELARGQNARALVVPGRDGLLYPDWIFTLAQNGSARHEPSLFFLELNRSTEPNVRYGANDLQSLARKYEGYLAYGRAKRHVEQFGVRNFRVLTVTTGGETKVGNVARTAYDVCGGVGSGRFLVTNFDMFSEHGDPFALPWLSASGEVTRLEL